MGKKIKMLDHAILAPNRKSFCWVTFTIQNVNFTFMSLVHNTYYSIIVIQHAIYIADPRSTVGRKHVTINLNKHDLHAAHHESPSCSVLRKAKSVCGRCTP